VPVLADPVWKECMRQVQLQKYGGANIPAADVGAWSTFCRSEAAMASFRPAISTRQAYSIPTPTKGGGVQANLDLGDLGTTIGGGLVDIGFDWIKSKLTPTTRPTGLAVPETKCPNGQIGIPPACFDLMPGGDTQGGGMYIGYGEAVMGRYGAAIQPAVRSVELHRCPRGAVLGNDGLCYNARDLRKSDRKWVPGRKPLLTGGDLNAIARASRAANKMKTQQKRLQKLGLLPKPNRGRGAPRGARVMAMPAGVPGVQLISND